MLARYLIIVLCAFGAGFGIGTYWQSLLRSLDTAERIAADAQQTAQEHTDMGKKAQAFNDIEKSTLKEMNNAASHDDDLRRRLAAGTHQLHLNVAAPSGPEAAARSGVADGAGAGCDTAPGQAHRCQAGEGPIINREVEQDYFAVRQSLKRCPAKVAALQAILNKEREHAGNAE